jgi:alpha-ribazole phosphatase
MVEHAAPLWCWRHPKAKGAAGRCIGRTDLPVDPRKAKRLAHRIRRTARLHGLPRAVHVSPLRRAHGVGRWLARWGWQVTVDARLAELDFGTWDGQPWSAIAWADVQTWQDDLLHHAPGGGESLAVLAQRVQAFVAVGEHTPRLVVSHGGWINALLHLPVGCVHVAARDWPAPLRHSQGVCWPVLLP